MRYIAVLLTAISLVGCAASLNDNAGGSYSSGCNNAALLISLEGEAIMRYIAVLLTAVLSLSCAAQRGRHLGRAGGDCADDRIDERPSCGAG